MPAREAGSDGCGISLRMGPWGWARTGGRAESPRGRAPWAVGAMEIAKATRARVGAWHAHGHRARQKAARKTQRTMNGRQLRGAAVWSARPARRAVLGAAAGRVSVGWARGWAAGSADSACMVDAGGRGGSRTLAGYTRGGGARTSLERAAVRESGVDRGVGRGQCVGRAHPGPSGRLGSWPIPNRRLVRGATAPGRRHGLLVTLLGPAWSDAQRA